LTYYKNRQAIVFTAGLDNMINFLESSRGTKQVIGDSDILSASFLDLGMKTKRSVARVEVPMTDDIGTGFLISNTLLMTNNHVIESKESMETVKIQFNYEIDQSMNKLPVDIYTLDKNLFYTNPDLDYTIVKLNGNPGEKWSFIPLINNSIPKKGNKTSIIHHPAGDYKSVSLLDGKVEDVKQNGFIKYSSDTLTGSSGAPVFDTSWNLIALHHFSGDQDLNGVYLNNEGIAITKILEDLKTKAIDEIQVKKILEEINLK
jgi:V8-like Glu-specific endopeptidase